jgi:hypothetical protein
VLFLDPSKAGCVADVLHPLAVRARLGRYYLAARPSAGKLRWFPPGAAMRAERITTSRDVAIAIGSVGRFESVLRCTEFYAQYHFQHIFG